jgi:peptidoglycan hydrolase-like protein with peptidoglycan-binding domain
MNKVFPRYRATPLVVDGIYGPATSAAVAEFQSRTGVLAVDGDVGPKTRAELKKYGVVV